MNNVTLTNLILQTRQRCDIENATARFTDAEITNYLNDSYAEFYDLVREAYGADYYMATTTPVNTVPGTELYSIPADFLAVNTVDIQLAPNIRISGRRYSQADRNHLRNLPLSPIAWTRFTPVWYRLKGQNISFLPIPAGAYTFTIDYVPTPTRMTAPSSTIDDVNGWSEYIVLDAAAKCMRKDQDFEMVQSLESAKAGLAERIRKMAPERDQGLPSKVQILAYGDGSIIDDTVYW